ncbi:MAG: MBL fold metallo-hydrolase [Candidatus Eisenbacteria bacterium]|nr:MBL fold metallo-hydrolase [Candidatus Eisenbacteria bacterium]
MGRMIIRPLAVLTLVALSVVGCSERETNPFDPASDTEGPQVTNFVYSGGEATWSTNEEALSVLEYAPVGGDYVHYVYASTKYHSTFHRVRVLGMEEGEEYVVRVRSVDRAGNTSYENTAGLPDTLTGDAFYGESLRLGMIDVGWGLSMALTTPDGSNVLIDAGYYEKLDDVLAFLDENGLDVFDAAVVTHYHIDHYGGFGTYEPGDENDGVLNRFVFNHFCCPDTTDLYRDIPERLRAKAARYDIPITYIRQGDSSETVDALDWDDSPGFEVTVLAAGLGGAMMAVDDSGEEGMNTNNDSVVLMIRYGDVEIITTGDAEHFTEYDIVTAFGRDVLNADFLQVGHHGSDDSSSELWLDNVRPRVAFISNAMVEAALAKEEVLQGLRAVDADYFITDRIFPNTSRNAEPVYGNLVLETDGESIEVTLDPDPH